MTKYHAVRDQLLDRLEEMASGEQLPPERDLAAELGVSRMTLRRAIDELVARGAVRRRHGSGVFALGPKLDQALMASSFSEDMRARGLRPGARTLSFDVGPVGARIRSRLKLEEQDDAAQVTRLRLADDEPIALEELHVPRALVPDLAAADLEDHSFYDLLRERCGIVVARSVQTIEPTVVDAQEAGDLDVPVHSPALLFERTSWSADDEPVEFVRSVYRGDRYKIRTELTAPGREGSERETAGTGEAS
ncbi:GntR family transcriptional regulator [Nesterenkonia sp. F]|uniref:GntR family transcriptional regulator n=1 Tax=Nesterenkonia sp. F TaxID=795955 RepID=UPI000255CA48|nr:GntR family transcriptional regulator [Nesterenkonia sp. F]